MLAIGAGAAAAVALAWLGLTSFSGSGGGASDVTLVLETDGGPGDLYVIDRVEDAEDTARDDRVLRDVRVAGLVRVVDGERVLSYDPFGYEHDGDPLFAYQEDGDDEWIIGVLDGREVVEIERVDGFPSVLVTSSGAYLTEQGSDSCSILRLSGRSAERVARADSCTINGSADVALLADRRSSGVEISLVDLESEEETTVAEFDETTSLTVSFSPDNQTVVLGGASDRPETVVVDLASHEVVLEEGDLVGYKATDAGFFAYELDVSDGLETTLLHYLWGEEIQEVLTGEGIDVLVDPAGSTAAILEHDGGDTILSMASIDGAGVGQLVEIEEFRGAFDSEFIDSGRLLVVDDDGLVGVADGQGLREIGELRGGGEFATPSIAAGGSDAWLVSLGEAIGVVTQRSDPRFIEIDDLESILFGVSSPDGRWMALVGNENASGTSTSLVLVDLGSDEFGVVDEDDGIGGVQFSGDYLYFEAIPNGDAEWRRVPLRFGERPEDIAEGVHLFLPGGPTPSAQASWDQPFWFLG